MSVLSRTEFHDEAKAFEHVESVLWPNGPVCPKCGSNEKHYKLTGVRTKPSKKNPNGVERHGLYKCAACRSQFTVRMGTIFEESHLPLHKWLQAIHLMCASKKGISAHQMHRILECKYETAWFLCHRIRLAMASGDFTPMGGPGGIVEADETFIGRLSQKELEYQLIDLMTEPDIDDAVKQSIWALVQYLTARKAKKAAAFAAAASS